MQVDGCGGDIDRDECGKATNSDFMRLVFRWLVVMSQRDPQPHACDP